MHLRSPERWSKYRQTNAIIQHVSGWLIPHTHWTYRLLRRLLDQSIWLETMLCIGIFHHLEEPMSPDDCHCNSVFGWTWFPFHSTSIWKLPGRWWVMQSLYLLRKTIHWTTSTMTTNNDCFDNIWNANGCVFSASKLNQISDWPVSAYFNTAWSIFWLVGISINNWKQVILKLKYFKICFLLALSN
jgi:hypothetical protein